MSIIYQMPHFILLNKKQILRSNNENGHPFNQAKALEIAS